MMKHTYALARLEFLPAGNGGIAHVSPGRICTPARFEGDDPWWSLYVMVEKPLQSGDTATLPVTTLVSDVAENLLRSGAKFDLTIGPAVVAKGVIISTHSVDRKQFSRIFKFGNGAH
jgi:hypothetical protein